MKCQRCGENEAKIHVRWESKGSRKNGRGRVVCDACFLVMRVQQVFTLEGINHGLCWHPKHPGFWTMNQCRRVTRAEAREMGLKIA